MNAVATGLGDFSSRKRTCSTSSDESYGGSKRWKTWHYVLEPDTAHATEGEESIYSLQEKSTDYAKDTSDTSSKSWSSVTAEMIEYEVISMSEFEDNATPFRDDEESTSTPEEIEFIAIPAGVSDSSDTSSKSSGLQMNDTDDSQYVSSGFCVQCHEKLERPFFRYCSACFKVRKSFFPPRPRSRKKRTSKGCETSSSGVGSSATATDFSEEKLSFSESPPEAGSSADPCFSGGILKKTEDDTCDACFIQKKDGGYVHGKIVHVYNCYRCASKIFKKRGRCPICNVRVRQVVKVVTS